MINFSSEGLMPIPKPVVYFFLFLAYIKFAASVLLYCLGLHDPAGAPLIPPWQEHSFFFPEAEAEAPKADAAPIDPRSIKNRLPVVEFSSLLQARRGRRVEERTSCVICLGEVEARDEVRELGNCGHAFHVGCIDRWVDVGQASCPLCRASLLPRAVLTRRSI